DGWTFRVLQSSGFPMRISEIETFLHFDLPVGPGLVTSTRCAGVLITTTRIFRCSRRTGNCAGRFTRNRPAIKGGNGMLRLHGITPVMVSPFWDDEGLEENNLRRQIDFAINNGAAAVAGPGYASEFYKMSDGERYRFAEVLVDQAKKRVPVIIATSSDSTYLTIEFSKFAERM